MIATLAEAALRSFVLGGVVWFGLNLFRVRNPHVHMTAWVIVLLVSLAMPFVMHWPTLTIARLPLSVPVPDELWPADISMLETPQPALPITPGATIESPARSAVSIDWRLAITIVYAGVAGLLLLRLAIGLCLTWRLARAAQPMRDSIMDADVRISRNVGGPVTFGSTILVPPQFAGWDAKKRLAVLAHEAPMSPIATSTSCCLLPSTARCSGSAHSRGGSWRALPSLPRSSATPRRSKSSTTDCPMRRSCWTWRPL
ncbi:hypothetical protein ACVWXO_005283 [Bradyrhizobium sp. LM2.7]